MERRIDRLQTVKEFLAAEFPQASERTRRQMVALARVTVNGHVAKSLKQPLRPGDAVAVGQKRVAEPVALPRGLDLIHEDDDIIVVNKAAGLLTSTTPREKRPTVVALLGEYLQRCADGEDRPEHPGKSWCVHRLDKDASGLLVLAKTESAWRWLKDDFRARKVHKAYSVLVHGRVAAPPGDPGAYQTIQSFLRENARNRMESVDRPGPGDTAAAKLAVTRYRVEHASERFSLLHVKTETGRKNQIRVHLAHIGHPVVGDDEYGSGAPSTNPIGRLGLHASELSFAHPRTGQTLRFESAAPASFRRAVDLRTPTRGRPNQHKRLRN